MHLLYIDESGDLTNADAEVAGLAVHESDVRQLARRVEDLLGRVLDPHLVHLEVHAQHIRKGKGPWRGVPNQVKAEIVSGIVDILAGEADPSCQLFGVVRHPGAVPQADPIERMFEELLMRFDSYVRRRSSSSKRELGLVVADEAKYAKYVQPMAANWQSGAGARSGKLRHLAEVPLFVDSKLSRLVQLADFVAHVLLLAYRDGDDLLFTDLQSRFQRRANGSLDGLVHLTPDVARCACWPCTDRRH